MPRKRRTWKMATIPQKFREGFEQAKRLDVPRAKEASFRLPFSSLLREHPTIWKSGGSSVSGGQLTRKISMTVSNVIDGKYSPTWSQESQTLSGKRLTFTAKASKEVVSVILVDSC